MNDVVPPQEVRRVSRKGLYIPVALFAVACMIWTGVWFFARSKAGEVMDAWIEREAKVGRTWTCPDRAIDGFPFRIQVSCASPTFASSEPGRAGAGSLGSLGVVARISDPKNLIVGFGSPLKWQASAGDSVELAFENGRASYRGDPGTLDQISFEFDKPVFTYRNPAFDPYIGKAGVAEFHLRRSPGTEPGTDIALMAKDVESPALNLLSGENGLAALDIRARAAKLPPVPPRNWRETAEAWRIAGGELQIERLNLSKGPIVLVSTGSLRIDDTHRLQGSIDGTAQGAQQILSRMGINIGGGAGGLLGALLNGGKPAQGAQQPKPLPVSIRFDQGRMFFGPIPGPRMLPLY